MASESITVSPERYEATFAADFVAAHARGESDGVSCLRSDQVSVQTEGAIEGRGLFAAEDIEPGTLVAVKLGRVVSEQTIYDNQDLINGSHQQIGPDAFLAGLTIEEVDQNLVGYNHSCEANATIEVSQAPPMAFVITTEHIASGQEIAVDYSLVFASDTQRLEVCRCGADSCRTLIAPATDWLDPDFESEHAGQFSNYITEMQRSSGVY